VSARLALALFLVASSAVAQEDDAACQTSYVAGQKLYKLDHDLLRGREQLLVCAKACPDQLRASCGKWLAEIERELPTVIVKAKDRHGNDIADVAVDVDDAPVTKYVEGLPFEVNPGKHLLRVHDHAGKAVDQTVLVNAGEKLKVVEVWLEPPATEVVTVRRPVPSSAYVLLGVSVAGLASFASFAILTTMEYSYTAGCTPNCNSITKDNAFDAETAIADISLAVSAAALLGAAIVYFTRPKVVERTPAAMVVRPTLGGLSITF
jgi:hypothetical protein